MWPTLLNMSRDDCRRMLRRLELEAYSNIIDVFRAQGALEDNRKKILDELRAVLHISSDRHSAEARRVANDEILATIAHQLAGPNTGLGWICEGRRLVPLMPRGIPQTMYTEIADKVAEITAEENKQLKAKVEAEKLAASKTDEELTETETAESAVTTNDSIDESLYPPIVTEDPTLKIWESEFVNRKRKLPEVSAAPEEVPTPVKNVRNIPVNTNQKHLNLSQIYSKFSQPASSKPSSQSKHSYNQVSKVSTSKSHQAYIHTKPAITKHRANRKTEKSTKMTKAQMKKAAVAAAAAAAMDVMLSPSKAPADYAGPPASFQASYAQSLLGAKAKDYLDDKPEPADPPPDPRPDDDPHAHKTVSGKPCQLIIKKRGDIVNEKRQMSDAKVLQKPGETVRMISNRPVVVAHSTPKPGPPTKLLSTKLLGPVKAAPQTPLSEKVIVVSKPLSEQNQHNSKILSSSVPAPAPTLSPSTPRLGESVTAKGIPATDIKVSAAKTFLLNPKSGQKMVVVPAKARPKAAAEGPALPLLQLKGLPAAMRLVPVGSQPQTPAKATNVTVVSKANAIPANAKVVSVEPIKTANMADIVPVKGLSPAATPKTTKTIVRPVCAKGNVIVVQKGATIGKALTLTKNGNDMSKIIMGKNVNQLLQNKQEQSEPKGNVIVLELNNDQAARATTMSEILDSRGRPDDAHYSPAPDDVTASSADSPADIMADMTPVPMDIEPKADYAKEPGKDSSSVTDWEMELDTVSRKSKDDDDKLNSLHLDLGMSSDSEPDFIGDSAAKDKHSSQDSLPETTPTGESRLPFERASGLSHATRTLLSQLQDEGSSSNDSSFALKAKADKAKDEPKTDNTMDKSESEALNKAKEKLSEKVAKSQQKRIDIYSTAISSAEMALDPFAYLEGLMDERAPSPH